MSKSKIHTLSIYGQMDPKMTIVYCARSKSENHQVLSFQSGFRDFENDRIKCCRFFQTEQTVNRKKSGFRAPHGLAQIFLGIFFFLFVKIEI